MRINLSLESSSIIVPEVSFAGPNSAVHYQALLDTGAAYTMVTHNMALFMGYSPSTHKVIPIATANGWIHAPLIMLRSVTVHDVVVPNVPALCHDIDGIDVKGILGLSFLKRLRTVLDYRELRLEIT